jgi:hypothetical protein
MQIIQQTRLDLLDRDEVLQRARRMALRSRAAVACLLCKASKARCSDYRPCARCKKTEAEMCTDLPLIFEDKTMYSNNSYASFNLSEIEFDGTARKVASTTTDEFSILQLPRVSMVSPSCKSFTTGIPTVVNINNNAMGTAMTRWTKRRVGDPALEQVLKADRRDGRHTSRRGECVAAYILHKFAVVRSDASYIIQNLMYSTLNIITSLRAQYPQASSSSSHACIVKSRTPVLAIPLKHVPRAICKLFLRINY